MRCATVITNLALIVQLHASEKVAKLSNKAQVPQPFHHANLDGTTLGKPGQLVTPTQSRLGKLGATDAQRLRPMMVMGNSHFTNSPMSQVSMSLSNLQSQQRWTKLRAVPTAQTETAFK